MSVHEMHLISQLRKPAGVDAWATTDVVDDGGRGWRVPCDELLSARQLDAICATAQPLGFAKVGVVLQRLVGKRSGRLRSIRHGDLPEWCSTAHVRWRPG